MENAPQQQFSVRVVGLITSYPYQKTKLCAERLHSHLPFKFTPPSIRGLLEVDWNEYLLKQRRKYGGQTWAITTAVVVYINDDFIGSYKEFLSFISLYFSLSIPMDNLTYFRAMFIEYITHLQKTKREYATLEITINGCPVGNMLFELYSDLLPTTCGNFTALCKGDRGWLHGVRLHYKNTLVHRIVKNGWIQCGDNEKIFGGGGMSIFGKVFADEGYCISHDRRGILSMCNAGKHTNGSQFFITLSATPWMNYYYVAFGRLVEGEEVLKAIESVKEDFGKPMKCIRISDCDVMDWKKRFPSKKPEPTFAVCEIPGEYWEQMKREPLIDIPDIRDVPSFLTEDQFLRGLYSYTKPEPLIEKVISQESEEMKECIGHILSCLVRKAMREVDKAYETELERTSYARHIAEELVRKAVILGDYETTLDRRTFALQIADEIVRRSLPPSSYETLEEKQVCMKQIAEDIVRQSMDIVDQTYESQADLYAFCRLIAEEIVRMSMYEPEPCLDLFSFSAVLARELIEAAEQQELLEHQTMVADIREIVHEMADKAQDIVETAVNLANDILMAVFHLVCPSALSIMGEDMHDDQASIQGEF